MKTKSVMEGEWVSVPWTGLTRRCCCCGQAEKDDYQLAINGETMTLQLRGKIIKEGKRAGTIRTSKARSK